MTTKKVKEVKNPIKQITYDEALKLGPMKFVKQYLFPAMRRAEGNGFAMSHWKISFLDPILNLDGVNHSAPVCGTAACIGGTMQMITGEYSEGRLGEILGLSFKHSKSLFYGWGRFYNGWPEELQVAFRKAETPLQKEKVAEKVILLAIKTKGECFNEHKF